MVHEVSNQDDTGTLLSRPQQYRDALMSQSTRVPLLSSLNSYPPRSNNAFASYVRPEKNNLSQFHERKPPTKDSNIRSNGKKNPSNPALAPSKSSSSFLYTSIDDSSETNFEPPPDDGRRSAPPNVNEFRRNYLALSQPPNPFPPPSSSQSQRSQQEFHTALETSFAGSSHTTNLKRFGSSPIIRFGSVEPELLMKLEFRDIFVKPSSAPSSMSAEASAGNGQVRTDKLIDNLLAKEIVNFWASLANKSEMSEVSCEFCRNHLKQCCSHTFLKVLSASIRVKNGR